MAKAKAATAVAETKSIRKVVRKHVTLTIKGTSPLIQHNWSEKAKIAMREKHQGRKTKKREVRDCQQEGEAASYRTDDGSYGIPLLALKSSIVSAAHRDLGIEKTLVRKALFIPSQDRSGVLKMECDEPTIQEDTVRVGAGSADLRYRPYFYSWSCEVTFEVDAELLTTEDILSLIDRAGFGVGIGEWRPEKGGEFGRFEVDTTKPVKEEE